MVVSTIYTCALSCKSEQDVRAVARICPRSRQRSVMPAQPILPAPHRVQVADAKPRPVLG